MFPIFFPLSLTIIICQWLLKHSIFTKERKNVIVLYVWSKTRAEIDENTSGWDGKKALLKVRNLLTKLGMDWDTVLYRGFPT